MEIIVRAYLYQSPKNIEEFNVRISEKNYLKARGKLEFEREKIVNYFKRLKKDEIINSIYRPKNKKIQKELDELVKVKKEILKSINKIKLIFRNI